MECGAQQPLGEKPGLGPPGGSPFQVEKLRVVTEGAAPLLSLLLPPSALTEEKLEL